MLCLLIERESMKNEKIKILRKGFLKKYKITRNICYIGIASLVCFLLFLVKNSVYTSVIGAFFILLMLLLVYFLIIFNEEYLEKKKMVKRLESAKYDFFHKNGFNITEDFYLEGIYADYYICIIPSCKWLRHNKKIDYDVIQAFYELEVDVNIKIKETAMSGQYYFGELIFGNNYVSFIPRDWKLPDFEQNIKGLLTVLRREELIPLSKQDWIAKIDSILISENNTTNSNNEV